MPIDRRHILGGMAAGLLLTRPGPVAAETEPPLHGEDYAQARAAFRTRLLRRGPAPDGGDPLTPPEGARPIAYRSGPLALSAWISANAEPARRLRPAVLFLHGGNALWHGHWDLVQPYVEAGYVAMMPALRAENGQAGTFSGFYDETDDVLAAAETLRHQPGIDADRLFLAGHSVGGTLTLLGALTTPIFRAAAAFSPNPDARAFFTRFAEDIRFDTQNPLEFEMRSAACFAGSFKCSALLLHGSGERGTDAAIRLTVDRARATGLDVRRGIIEGDHTSAIPGETMESLRFFEGL